MSSQQVGGVALLLNASMMRGVDSAVDVPAIGHTVA